jgi:hypothetical protein
MTTRAAELSKLLLPFQNMRGVTTPYVTSYSEQPSFGWAGFFTILLVLFIVLLIVHFTIKPIFSFADGDDGFIPLGYRSDGQLTWDHGPVAADLSANVVKIIPCGITIQQDIYIENETVVSNQRRVFFYRSGSPLPNIVDDPTKDLITQFPETNLIMYLLPNTNDLAVSAITDNNGTYYIESASTLLNVPIRQPFRLTVVLYQRAIEVYLNGNLSGTKTFRYPVRMSKANFYGAPNAYRISVRTMNFKYWDRTLQAREITQSSPALADMNRFTPASLNGGCA